jgi:hypothetical protein
VFPFHRPETLERRLKESLTLRGRLLVMPPSLLTAYARARSTP